MKKRIFFSILAVGCLCFPARYVRALSIDWAHVWRDNIVHETGAFTDVQDRDKMSASAKLIGVSNPDDYLVHLTSGDAGFVDIYLSGYRDYGGGAYEFVDRTALPAPGPPWEMDTYLFDLVDSATKSTIYNSMTWTIPDGYVTNPLDIPAWHAFSGDLLHPTVEWDATLSPGEGLYSLRVYELNPDGSFNYQAITHSTSRFAATTWTLDDFTMEYGKSYAIGIQSIISHPDLGGTINRSQYYVRYDTAPVPEPATMLLLGSGLIGLAGFRRKWATKGRS